MKRFLAGLIVGAVLATAVTGLAQSTVVRLFVNGQEIQFPEAPPQIINGRTMVPARPLAEALGATVGWDNATKSVLVTATVADRPVYLDVDGRLMMQVRPLGDYIKAQGLGFSYKDGVAYVHIGERVISLGAGVFHEGRTYFDLAPLFAEGFNP